MGRLLANDAIALVLSAARVPYGPRAVFPSAVDMGDKALYVDPSDNQALWQVQSGNWVRIGTGTAPPAAPAGVPVLRGPYTVGYTDIPHDGDKKTLWTPAVGDVLLRLFPDYQTTVQWDQGTLFVGQGVDAVSAPGPGAWRNVCAMAQAGHIGGSLSDPLDTLTCLIAGNTGDASGAAFGTTAYVCHTTDPVQIQLAQTGGTDPTAGHVALYALIARAVAP